MSLSLVDRSTLDELGGVIGAEKLGRLVDRFAASLVTAFAGDARTHADYAREAHTLISMSGMLGCTPLSLACRRLEQATEADADLPEALVAVRALRDHTIAALLALRAEAGADP